MDIDSQEVGYQIEVMKVTHLAGIWRETKFDGGFGFERIMTM